MGFSASVSLPSGSGSAIEVARSLLDLGQSRELGLGEAGDPAPLPSLDAVSAGFLYFNLALKDLFLYFYYTS